MRPRLATVLLPLLLWLGACASLPWPAQAPPRVLHPQVGRVEGEAWIRPRHAREARPLTGPVLLEPGDTVFTGPAGKVELLLPEGAVRLFGDAEVRVPFAFEGRTPVCRELRVEEGEVLVRRWAEAPFQVRTDALELDLPRPVTVLVARRGETEVVEGLEGEAEARNVSVRGQTVIRLKPGIHAALAVREARLEVETRRFPNRWAQWEKPGVFTAGALPPPAPQTPPSQD
ncbi:MULTISPECIES: FecR family protein [Deferrisoma]